ncbi:MAG TPA: hypothetical protein VKX31_00150 [Brumimicrobium sp.]|nr:hypothetical protein [Brumimicrobium sp.]
MKYLIKTTLVVGFFTLLLFSNKAYSQIETGLRGAYTVLSGSPVEVIEVFDNKVEAKMGGDVVERYFFFEKENETYILEFVKLDAEFVDPSIAKDRKLIRVNLEEIEENKYSLNLLMFNGKEQDIIMVKTR